jgi:hypothetical protein
MAAAGHLQLRQDVYPYPVPDGLVEEQGFRALLGTAETLEVLYSEVLDREFAIDAVVTVRDAPLLFPVGVQFTVGKSCAKKRRAIDVFRRTRVVPRFLYLRCRAPLTGAALNLLMGLIVDCARSDEEHCIASAVLRLDGMGRHVLAGVRHYTMV